MNRNMLAAFVAHVTNHLFQLVLPTVLPLVVIEFGLSHYSAGLLLGLYSLPYALLQLVFGEASDRFGRRRLIVFGTLASSITMLLTGLSRDIMQLGAIQVIAGIAGAAYHPAGIPLISESSGTEGRGRALGYHQMGGALGSFLPPIIMGAIARISGWRGAVILASTIGFLSTLLSFSILEEPVRPRKEGGKSGILMALREKSVLLLLMASLVSLIAYRGIAAFASLYVVEGKGQTVEEAAAYYALFQVAGAFGGPIGGWLSDKIGEPNMIVAFVLFESAPVFLLPFLSHIALALDLAIVGFGSFAVLAVQDAYLSKVAPKAAFGASYGLLLTLSFLPAAYIPPAVGIMIDRNGFESSFAIAALATLASIPIILMAKKATIDR